MPEKIFANGFYFKKRDGAPVFVVGQLSLKVPDVIPFLEKYQNNAGFVNIDIKESSKGAGNYYCELNTYTQKEKVEKQAESIKSDFPDYPHDDVNPDDVPF